jgi:hypothetical protein
MTAKPVLVSLGRAALGLAVGALIGAAQVAVVVAGMRRGDRTTDLSGLGVAAGAAVEYLVVTLVLILAACWLLRMRLWGLADLAIGVVQLIAVAYLFAHSHGIGLHGHARAVVFAIVAALCMSAAATWWPNRLSATHT